MNKKFISSFTDWALICAFMFLFVVEICAVLGFAPKITDELVDISIYQLWVPFVFGILGGHFFPLPFRLPRTKLFITIMFSIVGGYILWYILTPAEIILLVINTAGNYLYIIFLVGFLLGSTFFGRKDHVLEE